MNWKYGVVILLVVALVAISFFFKLPEHLEYQRCKTLRDDNGGYHPAPNRGGESDQGRCLFDLATSSSNVQICNEIPINSQTWPCKTQGMCGAWIAITQGNIELCDLLTNQSAEDYCKEWYQRSDPSTIYSVSIC